MARVLSTKAQDLVAQQLGTKPVNVLSIEWIDGSLSNYADRDIFDTANNVTIKGKIIQIDPIDEIIAISNGATTAEVGITLDDTDGSIKALMDVNDIHQRPAQLFQYYDDSDIVPTDAFSIFYGEVSSPIVWNESNRTISFRLMTKIYHIQAGFSPESGQFPDVPNEFVGRDWPLAFGGVIHVPAVQSHTTITTATASIWGLPDQTLPLKLQTLQYAAEGVQKSYQFYLNFINIAKYKQQTFRWNGSPTAGKFTLIANGIETDPFNWDDTKSAVNALVNLGALDSNKVHREDNTLVFDGVPVPITIGLNTVDVPFGIYPIGDAADVQTRYADIIIEEDKLKQVREDISDTVADISAQLEKAARDYSDAEASNNADAKGKNKLIFKALKQKLSDKSDNLESTEFKLKDCRRRKAIIEFEAKNVNFLYSTIGKCRNRLQTLIQSWYQVQSKINTLQQVIAGQQTLLANQIIVPNGYKFAQNQELLIDLNGMKVVGRFADNPAVFTVDAFLPTYEGIPVIPDPENSLTDFFLGDSTTDLTNCYLQVTTKDGSQYITKVQNQFRNKVTIEIPQLQKDETFSNADQVVVNGNNVEDIKGTLRNLLIGTETQDQIQAFANAIPRDISPKLWAKLQGTSKPTQTLVLDGTPSDDSTFRLDYGGFVSSPLSTAVTANTVASVVLGMIGLYEANGNLPALAVTTTGGPLSSEPIVITIDQKYLKLPILPIGINTTNVLGTTDKISAALIINNTEYGDGSGTYTIEYPAPDGAIEQAILELKATASDIQTFMSNPNITVVGEISANDLDFAKSTIVFQCKNPSDYDELKVTDTSDLSGPLGHPELIPTMTIAYEYKAGPVPSISIRRDSIAAHEHTLNEIAKIVKAAQGKTSQGKALQQFRQVLMGQIEEMNNAATADQKSLARDAYLKSLNAYVKVVHDCHLPASELDKAYQLISEHEYKTLFSLEMMNFAELQRLMVPINADLPDEATNYYFTARDIVYINQAAPTILPGWVATYGQGTQGDVITRIHTLPSSQAFVANVGSTFKLWGAFQEKYIANLLPSTVHAVYAYRNVEGIKQLFPVPSSYYVKNESDPYGYYNCTTITLARPLSFYKEDLWEDNQIYVTMVSSVGPNPVDIITWLLETYTNVVPDSTSFNYVKNKLTKYPACFALLNKQDAVQFCQDIAWQSRCSLWVDGKTAYIRYISEEPTSVDTITESDVLESSLTLSYTPTEDIVTWFTAVWQPDYSKTDVTYRALLRANIAKYGEIMDTFQFTIYNDFALVMKSATFWMIRRCNTWKIVSFHLPLTKLHLQTNDCITLNFDTPFVSTGPIKGIIQSAQYDPTTNDIAVTVWLPIRAGEMTQYDFAWPAGISENLYFPTVDTIVEGNAGSVNGSQVPTGNSYDPNEASTLALRPLDYGDIFPSDTADKDPHITAADYIELDYKKLDIDDFGDTLMPITAEDGEPALVDLPDNESADTYLASVQDKPTASFYGVVLQSSTNIVEPAVDVDGGEEEPANRFIYKVRLVGSGRIVDAEQIMQADDDTIPFNTVVLVVWDESIGRYLIQHPTWNAPDVPSPDNNGAASYKLDLADFIANGLMTGDDSGGTLVTLTALSGVIWSGTFGSVTAIMTYDGSAETTVIVSDTSGYSATYISAVEPDDTVTVAYDSGSAGPSSITLESAD